MLRLIREMWGFSPVDPRIEWESIEYMKRAVLSRFRESLPLQGTDSASLHSGIYISVWTTYEIDP